jgi:NADH-quinone oxidoreductase subunit L
MMILAIGAVGVGYFLLPPALGVEHPPFQTWLSDVWKDGQAALAEGSKLLIPVSHTTGDIAAEWVNIAVSSLIAIGVSVFAFLIYSRPENIEKVRAIVFKGEGDDAVMQPWYRVVLNKYYVDEIYDMLFVKPLKIVSDILFVIVDAIIIDLLIVNGSAMVVKASSDLARRMQTGFVRHYLYAFATGAVILTALFLLIANQR